MKTGISSYTYGWAVDNGEMDAFELVRRADAQGFRLLQIGDNIALDGWSQERLQSLGKTAQRYAVELEVGMRGLTYLHALQYIQIAQCLHARLLRVVVDAAGYEPDPQQIVTILQQLTEPLEQADVVLAIENHDRLSAGVLAEIICAVGHARVGICLDTANSFGAGEDVGTVLPILMPYAVNVHLKDFAIQRLAHKQGFLLEGRPLGKGMLPVQQILEQKRTFCPEANLILELWTPPEVRVEETIHKEAAWALESMRFIKKMALDRAALFQAVERS